ncbi:MAG TPA: aquaporin [Candidatus Limnocylindrales bacterium]|nr:aquaporin [Candidatus Limnocylindrales bacterium]
MDRPTLSSIVAEAVGTFLFVLVGAGSIAVGALTGGNPPGGLVGVAFAHGLALAIVVSSLGAISGGHVNPAVTFGVWVAGRMSGVRAIAYVVAQLVGAVAAGFALRVVIDPATDPSHLGTPALAPGVGIGAGTFLEALTTMLLLMAVFGTAVDPRAPKIGGLAIGLSVAADILFAGPLTGAAMNPARWFGSAIASGTLDNWYVWWIGPLIGAGIIAVIYRFVFLPEAELSRTPASPGDL